MLKTPTRQRQFSQFRNSPAPATGISRRVEDVSPARPLTATPSHQLLTPTRKAPQLAHQRTTSTRLLNHSMSRQERLPSKPKEICVNCVNDALVNQHKDKKKRQAQQQDRYVEEQRALVAEEAQLRKRKEDDRKIRELQFSRSRQAQTRKDRERLKQEQERKRDQENMRVAKQKQDYERIRQQEAERSKKENFKRQLEKQVRDQLERRRQQKKNVPDQKQPFSIFNTSPEKDAHREAANAKRLSDYKVALRQQIEDNAQRIRKEREHDKAWNQRLMEIENSRPAFEPRVRVTDAKIKEQLKHDVEQRSNKKLRQLEQQRRKSEEAARQAEQQYRESLKRQKEIQNGKLDKYMKELNNQLQENRERKLKEREFEKIPGFTQPTEAPKKQYQDCDKCHVAYPKNYISIFDY